MNDKVAKVTIMVNVPTPIVLPYHHVDAIYSLWCKVSRVEAIRFARAETGMDLSASKALCEAIVARQEQGR